MEIHFNLTSMKVCHFQLPFIILQSNVRADGDLSSLLKWSNKTTQKIHISEIACTILFSIWGTPLN